jgi:hypothetical protein
MMKREPCPASNSPAHLTLRHDKGKVALSSSAYKYPRRGCRKREGGGNRNRRGLAGEKKRESEGDRERDRQLLERKRGETERVKHHGRERDRK